MLFAGLTCAQDMHQRMWDWMEVAGASAWTPADLGIAGTLWFDGDEGLTLSGANVSSWTDQYSGLVASNVTSSAWPTFSTNKYTTGSSALYFDGNDFLCYLTPTNHLAANAKTIIAIVTGAAPGFYQFALATRIDYGGVDNTDYGYLYRLYTQGYAYSHTGGGDAIASTGGASEENVILGVAKASGTSSGIVAPYKNAASLALSTDQTLTDKPEFANGYTSIGRQGGTGYAGGYLGSMVYVPAVLSTDDRQKVEGYLAHRYALTALLPADHPYKSAAPTK